MLIISKFKDYYDYLQGIWGVDEKRTLDRSNFITTDTDFKNYMLYCFYIGDYYVEGVAMNGKILYGSEIEPFIKDASYQRNWANKMYPNHYLLEGEKNDRALVLKEPKLLKNSPTNKLNCPILSNVNYRTHLNEKEEYSCQLDTSNGAKPYKMNPILKDYSFHKVFDAEKIWLILSDWLGKDKIIPNNQTDKDKIVSAGFDLKASFRHRKS